MWKQSRLFCFWFFFLLNCDRKTKTCLNDNLLSLLRFLSTCHREILQEIQRLRLQHEEASQPPPAKGQQNPTLLAELRLLRYLLLSLPRLQYTTHGRSAFLLTHIEQLIYDDIYGCS